tara:strand:- start:87 stop:1094 length:1008 start_codon:yes stop_codon:yes gene_type:complete
MIITHTNSVHTEDIVLYDHIPRPQYVHQVTDGGLPVKKGIKTMPSELIDCVLKGKYGASLNTVEHIKRLTAFSNLKIGFVLAAGGNSWPGYMSNLARTNQYPTHRLPALGGTQVYAGYIANRLGSFDYITTEASSCISGHAGWYIARNLMLLDIMDAMVVITVDNGLSEDYLDIFGEHGLSKQAVEEDTDVIKFRLGQGCNISVFESDECVRHTHNQPIARVKDMCVAAESHTNPLGISDSGEGYTKVITGVDTAGITFVKTHSTFSCDNVIEAKLVANYFGDIRIVNYKLRIGHTMGASTAVETALAIKEESGIFLSLGAGMGNAFSSAVVEIF